MGQSLVTSTRMGSGQTSLGNGRYITLLRFLWEWLCVSVYQQICCRVICLSLQLAFSLNSCPYFRPWFCRDKIVDSRAFHSWSLIHGSSWSGLIKLGPRERSSTVKFTSDNLFSSPVVSLSVNLSKDTLFTTQVSISQWTLPMILY